MVGLWAHPAVIGNLASAGARPAAESEAFALQALALNLAGAANGLSGLAGAALRRLLVMPAQLHLAEDAFALQLLLEGLEGLIDIVIPNDDLHAVRYPLCLVPAADECRIEYEQHGTAGKTPASSVQGCPVSMGMGRRKSPSPHGRHNQF
jgi:hypothetical protein